MLTCSDIWERRSISAGIPAPTKPCRGHLPIAREIPLTGTTPARRPGPPWRASTRRYCASRKSCATTQVGSLAAAERATSFRALLARQWPERDRLAWEAARRRDDLLDPDGRAASWTRKSVRSRLLAYGLWLDHLDRTSRLDPAATAGSRVCA